MTEQVGSVRGPLAEGPGPWFGAVLFTDIQESTPLWERYPDRMPEALARHHRIIEQSVTVVGGTVIKNIGDGFVAAFPDAATAVSAAVQAQVALSVASWNLDGDAISVRMAVDCGEIEVRDHDVGGPAVNRCARLMDVAHGGQILVSDDAVDRLDGAGVTLTDLGSFSLKGIAEPVGAHRVELEKNVTSSRLGESLEPGGIGWAVRGFELRERIGAGVAGVVYRAHQRSVGREVAIKLIRPEYANDRRFVHRFESEAQFIARLEHPHIVSLYDYWRDPDGAYLVMRWLRGGSLRQALERGPWHEQPTIRLLQQIGSALAYAHRRGVIHRDVRPSNILLDEEGNGYLSDFGIASRPLAEGGGSVSTSSEYRSPEEIAGRPLTEATDQFCLAMVAHELLTGRRPSVPFRFDLDDAVTPALAQAIHRASAEDPAARFPSVEAFLASVGPTLDLGAVETDVSRNPFKGLRPFFEADAADFFGRDELVNRLVRAVASNRLVTVVGASGSGKSSAVRAGLVPALRRGAVAGSERWYVADLYPGAHPFDELASALLSIATQTMPDLVADLTGDTRALGRIVKQLVPSDAELVLVLDQFEELFTRASAGDRAAFLDAITDLVSDAHARARVVVTLRADFYDRPLAFSEFARMIEPGLVSVPAPTRDELTAAIREPSQAVGLSMDPALVELILAEVVDQSGALPLLQYTLTELFDARTGSRLTTELFTVVGGVRGSLSRRAEAIFGSLDPAARTACEQIFLRLVSVEEDAEDTRRRIRRASLDDLGIDAGSIEAVLDAYGRHRLLTFDHDPTTRDPTVELAHEALLRGWSRLAGWIDERRQDLITEHHLAAAVSEWEQSGRDPDHLLTGARLAHYETWARGTEITLGEAERNHLSAARAREIDQQTRRNRLRRWVTAGFALVAVMATLFAITAWLQRNRAIDSEQLAEAKALEADANADQAREAEAQALREERSATARGLASAATANLDSDPELSILLALRAIQTTREIDGYVVREAEEALHEAVTRGRYILASEIPPWTNHVEFDAEGLLYNSGDNEGRIIDVASGDVVGAIPAGLAVAVSPDGRTIATGDQDGSIALRSRSKLEIEAVLQGHTDRILDLEFAPGGALLASLSGDGTARLWDIDRRELLLTMQHQCDDGCPILSHLDISPDGRFVGIAALGLPVVWDLTTLEQVEVEYPMYSSALDLAFLADGERMVTASFGTGTTHVFEVSTGRELARFYDHSSSVMAVEVSPDGTTFATAGRDNRINIYSTDSPVAHKVASLPGLGQNLAYSSDGQLLAAAGARAEPGRLLVLDMSPTGLGELGTFQGVGDLVGNGLSPDGDLVAAGMPTGDLALWRVSTLSLYKQLPTPVPEGRDPLVAFAEFSPDGSVVIAGGVSYELTDEEAEKYGGSAGEWFSAVGWVRAWDVESGEPLHDPMPAHFGDFPADASFSADGTRVAVGAGGNVVVYELPGWRSVFDLSALRDDAWADAVGLSPDGQRLATEFFGDPDEATLEVWDVASGRRIWGASASSNFWGTAAFSPDGRSVLSAGMEPPAVWNADSGTLVYETDGDSPARRATWGPDGTLIAAGVDDGSIHLWSAATGEELLTLRGHDSEVMEVEIADDNSTLASIDAAGRIVVWTLDLDRLIHIANERLTRDFTDDECRTYLHVESCSER